ncbi:hypothetical protein [Mycobacterium sp. URHB0021]|jgi:hypothetical protein
MTNSVPQHNWLHVSRRYLPPVVPVLAIVLMPFLPFVNAPGLWLGLPKMMVWAAFWTICLTPAMAWSQRLMERDGMDDSR